MGKVIRVIFSSSEDIGEPGVLLANSGQTKNIFKRKIEHNCWGGSTICVACGNAW